MIDSREFRDVLGRYASGITVISGLECRSPVGFTCQSFYSVSVDPPLISFSVMRTSTSYPRIRPQRRFAVNVLAHDQEHISKQFARSGADKWQGISWEHSETGNPLIAETLMWLDCELWAEHDAGDHIIVIGRVLQLSPPDWSAAEPLLFYNGRYRRLKEARGQ